MSWAVAAADTPALSMTRSEADAHRKSIVARVNADPSATWVAVYPPVSRFARQDYSVMKRMAGVLGSPDENAAGLKVKKLSDMPPRDVPDSFDAKMNWPQCPLIGEIRDQSACGSCYAVSAASAATDRFCIAHNGTRTDRLSGVDLMSCCKTCAGANGGCFGGTPSHCWDYISSQGITSGGAYGDYSKCLEYPFPPCEHHTTGSLPTCPDDPYLAPTCWWACDSNSTGKMTYDADQASHKFATSYKVDKDVLAIQTDILNHGPAQASMFLVAEFEVYKSGVFTTQSKDYIGAHAVRVVGWGVDGDTPYWRVANSWNTEWGEEGYFRIERGANILAIEASIVAGTV